MSVPTPLLRVHLFALTATPTTPTTTPLLVLLSECRGGLRLGATGLRLPPSTPNAAKDVARSYTVVIVAKVIT